MGLFDKIKRAFKANINDIISKAENPQKMLNQVIIDMNEQLIEAKKSVALAIADEKKLERHMNQQFKLGKEWESKAMLAVKAGKDDLAKEALLRKQEYDKAGGQYKEQWDAQHNNVESLKGSLKQLQTKIDEAQRKKNLLIARAKRAEAQKKIQATLSNIADNSAFAAFDRMSEKVEQIEAEAEAQMEMDQIGSSVDADLESQFAALESSSTGADLLLEDLKKKMEDDTKQLEQ